MVAIIARLFQKHDTFQSLHTFFYNYFKSFAAEDHDHDELQIDFRIKRDVDDNEGGQLVGETKCENIPRRVCIPNNCGMTESKEEECHNKKSLVLQEIPEEVGKHKVICFIFGKKLS